MKIDRYDATIIAIAALKGITMFLTFMVMALTSSITGASIEQTATVLEANPAISVLFFLPRIGTALSLLLVPASLLAVYHVMKPYLMKTKEGKTALTFFVTVLFYSTLFNIMADSGSLLGLLMKWVV